jgi:hypothetical protein
VSAERHLPGRFPGRPSQPGFEPLSILIDEAYEGDRSLTDGGRQGSQFVVGQLGRGVQNVKAVQGGQPFRFVLG